MVQIITDSTCDLTRRRLEEIGVVCVPLTVHFGEKTYIDGVNLTSVEFYENLRTQEEIPTTAQPTPLAFEEAFKKVIHKGDEVLCVLISKELSGTVQSATIAKNTLESEQVLVFDSRNACIGLGILVEIAAMRAKEGRTAAEIYEELEELAGRTRLLAAVETLKYLKKGGRLSGTAAMLGTMLNLHPVLTITDGKVLNIGKAKGKKKLYALLREIMKEDGIDEAYPVMFGHGQALENWRDLRAACKDDLDVDKTLYGEVGPVVGTHTGPGVVAVAYIAKNKK